MKNRYFKLGLLILSFSLLRTPAGQAEEEPTPGVARVSLIHGDVSTQRGDSGDWVASTVNAPVVAGDKISTGPRSRTEIELDHANILRLDQRTQAKLAGLTRTLIQVQVAEGTVNFTVLKGSQAQVEINTPNMAVQPLGEGSYRIQVNSPSDTEVTVRKGEAEVSTPQGSTKVDKGHIIYVRGAENAEYQVAKAPGRDEWDQWNRERDHLIEDAASWRYANRYYTGAHDLDRYGHWEDIPDYGPVWAPYVGPDWVPYHYGRWVWEPYWGWTWVSYEPWGWAPYHYGRWFPWGGSWVWWPGFVTASFVPIWAPAFVTFFGFGGLHSFFSFGVGFGNFGFASIGWLPLGPSDFFFPWWGFNRGFNVVNVTNITNITNIRNVTNGVTGASAVPPLMNPASPHAISNVQQVLNNTNVRRAITTVSGQNFVNGQVPRNSTPVNAAMLRQAQAVTGTVPAVPTRESLRPVDRPVGASALASQTQSSERFFTKRQPPAGPQPFSQQVSALRQRLNERNLSGASGRAGEVAPGIPGRRMGATVQPNAASTGSAATAQPQTPVRTQTTGESGWRRFGQPTASPAASFGRSPSVQESAARRNSGTNLPRGEDRPVERPPQAPSAGWQRFGSGASRSAPAQANPPRPSGLDRQPSQEPPANWQRFPAPAGAVARGAQERSELGNFSPRAAPSVPEEQHSGWQRFTPEAKQAPLARGAGSSEPREGTRPAPRSEGWFNWAIREETRPSTDWRTPTDRQAPRNFERPPLELRKPIVIERAPSGHEGGWSRSGWSAGGNHSGWSGGGRSTSSSSGSSKAPSNGKH